MPPKENSSEQTVFVVDGPYRDMVRLIIQASRYALFMQSPPPVVSEAEGLQGKIVDGLKQQACLVGSQSELDNFIACWLGCIPTAESRYVKDTMDASIFCNLQHFNPAWTRFFLPSAMCVTTDRVTIQDLLIVLPSDERLAISTSLAELSMAGTLTIQQFLDNPPVAEEKLKKTKRFQDLILNFEVLKEKLEKLLSEYLSQLVDLLMQKFIADNIGSINFSYLAEIMVGETVLGVDHKKPAGLSIIYGRGEAASNNFMLFNIENMTEMTEDQDPRRVTLMMSARSFPVEYDEASLRARGLNFTAYPSVAVFNWLHLTGNNKDVSGVLSSVFDGVFCRSRLALLASKEQNRNDRVFRRKNYCDMGALMGFLKTTDISNDKASEYRLSYLSMYRLECLSKNQYYQAFTTSIAQFAKSFKTWQENMSNDHDKASLKELLAYCQTLCVVGLTDADVLTTSMNWREKCSRWSEIIPEQKAVPISIIGQYEEKIMPVLERFKQQFPAINVEEFFCGKGLFSDLDTFFIEAQIEAKKTLDSKANEASNLVNTKTITIFILGWFKQRFPAIDVEEFFCDMGLFSDLGEFINKAKEASEIASTAEIKAFLAGENDSILPYFNLLNLRDFLHSKKLPAISEELDSRKLSKLESRVPKAGEGLLMTPEARKEEAEECVSSLVLLPKSIASPRSKGAVVNPVSSQHLVSTEVLTELARDLRCLLKQLKNILSLVMAVPDGGVHLESESQRMTVAEGEQLRRVLKESPGFAQVIQELAARIQVFQPGVINLPSVFLSYCHDVVSDDSRVACNALTMLITHYPHWYAASKAGIDYDIDVTVAVASVLSRFKRCLHPIYVEKSGSGANPVILVRCSQSLGSQQAPVGYGSQFNVPSGPPSNASSPVKGQIVVSSPISFIL